jgi:hypothetical protein
MILELIGWWLMGCAGFTFLGHVVGYAKGRESGRAQAEKDHGTALRS